MRTNTRFDPIAYMGISTESSNEEVLNVAFNLDSPSYEELPNKSELDITIDQELVDLDNLYQDMHDIDERMKHIAHTGVIDESDARDISKRFPGVIVTDPIGTEGRSETGINLTASVENMKRLKLGVLVSALISVIAMLMAWVKKTKTKSTAIDNKTVKDAPVILNNLLTKTDSEPVQVYKTYLALKNNETPNLGNKPKGYYLSVGQSIDALLGKDTTLETVVAVFSRRKVDYATIFANSTGTVRNAINREVLLKADGRLSMEKDNQFLETGRYEFRTFIDDCAKFSNEIPRWLTGMKDGVAVGKDGRTLSPETRINTINLDVIVNMSKTLGLALDQPTHGMTVEDAHQFITINKTAMSNWVSMYRNQVTDKDIKADEITHLNKIEEILAVLQAQQPALLDWKKQIRANSSTLGNMSRQLKQVRSRIDNLPRDASLKADELEQLANMVVTNFASMTRYIVVVDRFNTTTSEVLKGVVSNIYSLNKALNSVKESQ